MWRNRGKDRCGITPDDLLYQYMVECRGVFVGFRFYLQESAMHVFNGERGAMFYNAWLFVVGIMVTEKLVYKGSGGSIKYKYP
jgi:hypothetical protein